MDEESYFDVENGHKVADWCTNENYLISKGQKPSFAQGYINYTKQAWPESYFFTMVDTVRVIEDFTKYSWTFELFNSAIVGAKGSNWIVHSEIEREIGFDMGYIRSVCEDYISCLMWNNAGYPCKWCYCIVQEQSPFNFTDFMKQRNRWLKGTILNTLYSSDLKII